jgi:hypothetical protein
VNRTHKGVIWVVGWLRNKQYLARLVVLETITLRCILFNFPPPVAIKNESRPRDVLQLPILENAETHVGGWALLYGVAMYLQE